MWKIQIALKYGSAQARANASAMLDSLVAGALEISEGETTDNAIDTIATGSISPLTSASMSEIPKD